MQMACYTDGIFGPVLSVVRVPGHDTALELVNANPYGNGVAVFTTAGGAARRFVNARRPSPIPPTWRCCATWAGESRCSTPRPTARCAAPSPPEPAGQSGSRGREAWRGRVRSSGRGLIAWPEGGQAARMRP